MRRIALAAIWLTALAYGAGAAVHIASLAGFGPVPPGEAPVKWLVLDAIYAPLDLLVAVGLPLGWRIGLWALILAALSQIVLYTIGRNWVLDVPAGQAPTLEAVAHLDGLLLFHVCTLAMVPLARVILARTA